MSSEEMDRAQWVLASDQLTACLSAKPLPILGMHSETTTSEELENALTFKAATLAFLRPERPTFPSYPFSAPAALGHRSVGCRHRRQPRGYCRDGIHQTLGCCLQRTGDRMFRGRWQPEACHPCCLTAGTGSGGWLGSAAKNRVWNWASHSNSESK